MKYRDRLETGGRITEVQSMTHQERYLRNQAKALAKLPPDLSGFREDILKLPCSFHVKERCNHGHGFAIYDPTGKLDMPASACLHCYDYINAAFDKDLESAEAHQRIESAVAHAGNRLLRMKVMGRIGVLVE